MSHACGGGYPEKLRTGLDSHSPLWRGQASGNDFTYNVHIPFPTTDELPNTLTAFR